jgi:hypothetical protein
MSGNQLVIPDGYLPEFLAAIAEQVAAKLKDRLPTAGLPQYYKFPEDIISMTGGHIPVGTIRAWKTDGYLRTFKLGRRTFVRPEDWQWFIDNHLTLMAARENNRGARLGKA